MSSKLFFIVAIGIVAVASGVAWRTAVATQATVAERADLAAKRAALDENVRTLREKLAATETARVAAQAALASKPAPSPKPPAKPSARPEAPNPMDLLMKDPKLQVLARAAQRAQFETSYGPFLKSHQLTPEQIAKLGDALAQFGEQKQDLNAILRQQKLKPDDPAIATLSKKADDELLAAQRDVLGADSVEQLHRYEQTLQVRSIAETLAGAAALNDMPLSAQQAEQLTQLMAKTTGAPADAKVQFVDVDWDQVDAEAAAVLSPKQLELFKHIDVSGGGPSRWLAQFQKAMNQARKSLTTGKSSGVSDAPAASR